MNAAPSKHPPREFLQAFGLGKLGDVAAAKVSMHLESCDDCKRQVAELSADSLLGKLQQANEPMSTPAPSETLGPQAPVQQPQPATPPGPNVPPELLNNTQYEIIRQLGAGGMGVVYLAKNKLMDRLEVLKVINASMMHKSGALDRFLREIRSAAMLSHDNVVKAHSALQFGELLVFAMEYVEGDDLSKVVKTQGPLPIANACFYARQVALGLQHAHEKNMVHRDIKPHNLILARDGKKHTVKILDFGLAKATSEKKLDRDLTGEGKMLGTPDYMAPEQIQDAAKADIRADIYSLGCTLYYFLTGATPFNANSLYGLLQAHQTQEARSVNLVRPEVPMELGAIVAKMMAKEPAKRYQKPIEVAKALAPFIAKGGIKASASAPVLPVAQAIKPKPTPFMATPKFVETMAPVPVPTPVRQATMIAANPFSFPPTAEELKLAPKEAPRRVKPWLFAAVAMSTVFLGLLVLLGVILLRVESKDGTLIIKSDDPNAVVKVTPEGGATLTYGNDHREIQLKPGKYGIELADAKSGLKLSTKEITLPAGGEKTVKISWEPNVATTGKVAEALPPKKVDLPKAATVDLGGGVKMEFVLIPKGKFQMGSPSTEPGRNPFENAFDAEWQHGVEITKPFYLAKYPVTQEQYEAITGKTPSYFSKTGSNKDWRARVQGLETNQLPVENVSWDDAQMFCEKMRGNDKNKRYFRLPTEAEWEYACRAGTQTTFFCGDDGNNLGDYAWSRNNANGRPHPVGEKKPNGWGLHDMHGNVLQWCEDFYGPYEGLKDKNPLRSAKYSGERHVMRGGSWSNITTCCRAAMRHHFGASDRYDDRGFRITFDAPSFSDDAALIPTADPDRKAAEYVLSNGGAIRLIEQATGKESQIGKIADLPRESFRLTWVGGLRGRPVSDVGLASFKGCDCKTLVGLDLNGTNVSDVGLAYFKDCKNLTELWLQDTKVGDEGLASFKESKSLEKLCLHSTQVTGPGLASFKDCKNLKMLSLERSQVGDAGLAYFENCMNLRELDLSGTKVSNAGLAYFKNCKNLTKLYLGDNAKVSDPGLAYFEGCKDLTQLRLDNTQVTGAGLVHLKDCKDLTYLDLSYTPVTEGLGALKHLTKLSDLRMRGSKVGDAGLAHLKDCKNLKNLVLTETKITPAALADLKKALPKCKIDAQPETAADSPPMNADPDRNAAVYVLSIGGVVRVNDDVDDTRLVADLPKEPFRLTYVNLSGKGEKVRNASLAAFEGCKNVTVLKLHETQVKDVGLAYFKNCKNLTDIQLGSTGVTDLGLAYFKDCTKVQSIGLNFAKITDEGLANFRSCKNLKILELFSVGVGDGGLAHFKDCLNLEMLNLSHTKVTDTTLVNFRPCKKITGLHLMGTQVTDKGMTYLKDCKDLRELSLAHTKVSDAGLANLKDCKKLRELQLHNTQMSDKGLAYFHSCENLARLSQRGSKVTKAGLDDFRKALPKCSIDVQP